MKSKNDEKIQAGLHVYLGLLKHKILAAKLPYAFFAKIMNKYMK